jgi:hypothetical protein
MSDRVSSLYRQQIISAGLLGGFMILSLVLVSQGGSRYQLQILRFPKDWYFDGLVTLIALTSLVLIFASWGLGYVASGLTSTTGAKGQRFRRAVLIANRVGLTMVMAVVSALLVPFSLLGGLVVFFFGALMLIVLDELRLRALREAHQELKQELAQAEPQPDS